MNASLLNRIFCRRGLCITFVIIYLAILFPLGFIGHGSPFPITAVFSLPGMAISLWMGKLLKASDPIYSVIFFTTNIIFYGLCGYSIGRALEVRKRTKEESRILSQNY
jgi:hypothetical protein